MMMEPPDSQSGTRAAEPEDAAGRAEEFRGRLVPHLRAWARHGIHFSVSPWDSPSWSGFLYGNGDASGAGPHMLEEYARCFTTGCLDLGPYRLPDRETLLGMTGRMPPGFGCIAVVAHDIMTYRFPYGHPDHAKRGERNPSFLDAGAMEAAVDPLLQPIGSHLRIVVLRCPRIYPTEGYPFAAFLRRLDGLLAALTVKHRVAVETGNPEYLLPEYFACLRDHGTAHVFSHRETLLEELLRPDALTSDVTLVRIDADSGKAPGERGGIRMTAGMRLGIPEAVRRCVEEKVTLYVDLHNGPAAPLSLLALTAMLDPELAKLSPLRRKAA